jgi:hypothetical protein
MKWCTSYNASKNGTIIGLAVWSPTETTLTGTRLIRNCGLFLRRTIFSLETIWSHHACCILLCHIKLFRGRLQSDSKLVILDFLGLSDVIYIYIYIYIYTKYTLLVQARVHCPNLCYSDIQLLQQQLPHISSKLQKFLYTILQNIVNELFKSCSSY